MTTTNYQRSGVLLTRKYKELYFPSVVSSLVGSVILLTDSILAGHFLGPDALSALVLISPLVGLSFILSRIIGGGVFSILARCSAESEPTEVHGVFTLFLVVLVCGKAIVFLPQFFFAEALLAYFADDARLLGMALEYYIPFLLTAPLLAVSEAFEKGWRLDGRPKFFSTIAIVTYILNAAFAVVFLKLDMGMLGLSVASIVSQVLGFMIMATHALGGRATVRLRFAALTDLAFVRNYLLEMLKSGFPLSVGSFLEYAKTAVLNKVIFMQAGSAGLVAFSLFNTCENIVYLFIISAGTSVLMMGGMLHGEKDYVGLRILTRHSSMLLLAISAAFVALLLVWPQSVLLLYGIQGSADTQVATLAVSVTALSFPALCLLKTAIQYYIAVNQHRAATLLSVLQGALIIPIVPLLGTRFGVESIWIALAAQSYLALLIAIPVLHWMRKASGGLFADLWLLPEREPNELKTLSYVCTIENSAQVSAYLHRFLEDSVPDSWLAYKASMLAEDLSVDILKANANAKGSVNIDLMIRRTADGLVMRIRDDGVIHNPLRETVSRHDEPESLSERVMANLIARKIEYRRVLDLNQLVITI
jgi:Na+-driven multidrug efflux pump